MREEEKAYMEKIEEVIESLGSIQRRFVLDKTGIRAIIRFIEDLEGRRPFFELDDPVVRKGRAAAERVIEELSIQLETLEDMDAPDPWEQFHEKLVESIGLQLEGYREMSMVFDDSNMDHISDGQSLVNQGMKILESGAKKE